jgi:IclR family transcriptional regulator, acetate operon repressor
MSTATPKSIRSRKTPLAKPPAPSTRVSSAGAGQPRATDRGLRLVSIVANHPSGVSLADAARAAELTSSTALRQLRSLESAGFAVHLPDSRWAPGEELFRIARSLGQDSLARLAQTVLVSLADQIGESAYLAEPVDATTATYTAMEQSRRAI